MSHPPAEQLDAFADGTLPAADRPACEAHLSRCAACRARVVERFRSRSDARAAPRSRVSRRARAAVLRLAEPTSPTGAAQPWRWPRLSLMATAAALLAAVGAGFWIVAPRLSGPEPNRSALRAGGPRQEALELLAPAAAAVHSPGTVTFTWRALPNVARYRVVVLDRAGDLVLELTTHQASATWPTIGAPRGYDGSYFWYVVAELADGEVRESEIRLLRVPGKGG